MKQSQTLEENALTLSEGQPLPKLWLSVEEAAPVIGDPPASIYRDIREQQFPFEFVKSGKRIKISARSLGLIGGEVSTA